MIGVYLRFDYWTLKEWKTAKVQNLFVAAYQLFTQMIALPFDMFTAGLQQRHIPFESLTNLDWHFMEVG